MTDRTTREAFLAAFEALERRGGLGGPSWLREQRRAALARFAELGLPTTRDEAWRYTSLAPVRETALELGGRATGVEPSAAAVAPFDPAPSAWSRLVFVNGRYSSNLSRVRRLPGGARLQSLGEALAADAESLRPYLDRASTDGAFAALNASFWQDGGFLHLPDGVTLDEPILLLFISTAAETALATHPRTLVVLGKGSRATLVESYVAPGAGAHLTNAVTEVVLGAGADLDHYRPQLESRRGFHVGRIDAQQGRDSRFASCAVSLGARLARNDVSVRLGAEGARTALSGLILLGGARHVDTHTVVDHLAPGATSRQLYKGILDGRSRAVFEGRVVVRPGAVRTDAHQTNKNLLLSDEVEVDSKPQLEIFADDVKCSHGAADGQLAPEALYYLRSRGLGEGAARTLLTHGFANEVLDQVRVEVLRGWLDRLVGARLRDGRIAGDAA